MTNTRLAKRLFQARHHAFDRHARARENRPVAMRKLLRRTFRPIGWVLSAALAVILSASCATAGEMTDAQKACCAAMGHRCGSMAQEHDCCATEMPELTGRAAAQAFSLSAPVRPLTFVAALPHFEVLPAVGPLTSFAEFDRTPPGTATRLLLTPLRI